jgi:hypothetical protein
LVFLGRFQPRPSYRREQAKQGLPPLGSAAALACSIEAGTFDVMPAYAGIHLTAYSGVVESWIPALAGMTLLGSDWVESPLAARDPVALPSYNPYKPGNRSSKILERLSIA